MESAKEKTIEFFKKREVLYEPPKPLPTESIEGRSMPRPLIMRMWRQGWDYECLALGTSLKRGTSKMLCLFHYALIET